MRAVCIIPVQVMIKLSWTIIIVLGWRYTSIELHIWIQWPSDSEGTLVCLIFDKVLHGSLIQKIATWNPQRLGCLISELAYSQKRGLWWKVVILAVDLWPVELSLGIQRGNRLAKVGCILHTEGNLRKPFKPTNLHSFGMWEEKRAPGENPCGHRVDIQTLYRQHL